MGALVTIGQIHEEWHRCNLKDWPSAVLAIALYLP
jgi:hypothetical protein